MDFASTKGEHASNWLRRRQVGTLGDWGDPPGLRVDLEWDGDEPGEVRDVVAAVVVDEWVFSCSLVPRGEAGEPIPGALRLGDLTHRRLWPLVPGMPEAERRAAVRDIQDAGIEPLETAQAQPHREVPTARQRKRASAQLTPGAIRDALIPMLTSPDVGSRAFVGWGRQLDDWDLAAGPLARQGQRRVSHEQGEPDGEGTRPLAVADGTSAQRAWRDGQRRLPTEPVDGQVTEVWDTPGHTVEDLTVPLRRWQAAKLAAVLRRWQATRAAG